MAASNIVSLPEIGGAKSWLGQSLPIYNVAGQVIIVLRGYFDGSGNEDPYRTLGGLAGTDEVWAEFEGKWNAILATHPLRPGYLHMREAAHTVKEFDRKKGWTDALVQELIFNLLVYLKGLDGDKIGSFACTVDAKAREELIAEGVDVPSIESICTFECCEMAWMWHVDKYRGIVSGSNYFFDIGEPYRESFEREWTDKREGNDPFWLMVQSVGSVEMRRSPELQGADLVAWAVNRGLQPNPRDYGELDGVIREAITHRRSFWDKERLRKKYARVRLN